MHWVNYVLLVMGIIIFFICIIILCIDTYRYLSERKEQKRIAKVYPLSPYINPNLIRRQRNDYILLVLLVFFGVIFSLSLALKSVLEILIIKDGFIISGWLENIYDISMLVQAISLLCFGVLVLIINYKRWRFQ